MNIIRFLFFNLYAFMLLSAGIAVVLIPNGLFVFIIRIGSAVFLAGSAVSIMLAYKRKLRMVKVLLRRNQDGIKMDSFGPYMESLCTQLVVIYVLRKLGALERFKTLFGIFCKRLWQEPEENTREM